MKINDFKEIAHSLVGSDPKWETRIAHVLNIQPRAVRRWAEKGVVADGIEERLKEALQIGVNSPSRGEWIFGESLLESGQVLKYLIHSQSPRFWVRVLDVDHDALEAAGGDAEPLNFIRPDEKPYDLDTGIVLYSRDHVLCEVAWLDKPDSVLEAQQWLEAGLDYLQSL